MKEKKKERKRGPEPRFERGASRIQFLPKARIIPLDHPGSTLAIVTQYIIHIGRDLVYLEAEILCISNCISPT